MSAADFKDIQAYARDIKAACNGQDTVFDAMEQIYFMEPADRGRVESMGENVKWTCSPEGHNRLQGAVRLMCATDPIVTVDRDTHGANISNALESAGRQMWAASGAILGQPAQWDLVLSGLLYGRSIMGIVPTQTLADRAGKGEKARAARTARRTPYLFEVYNPRGCYPVFDRHGLSAFYRETETTVRQVRGDWGEAADKIMGNRAGSQRVILSEYWDATYHVVWVNNQTLENIEHGYPFIPVVVTNTEGSPRLFSQADRQLHPLLYALDKSKIWQRQNLGLTVLYTMIFSMGANPMFLYRANQPGKRLNVDYSQPGGIVTIEAGEDYGSLLKQVIDPSLLQGLTVANELAEASTIYSQALGQPMGGGTAYSTVALLTQSGRLPLTGPQRTLSWLIAEALRIAFEWLKLSGEDRDDLEIPVSEIPDDIEMDARLDIVLPQEYLQMLNQANLGVGAGLFSKAYGRQLMNINDPEAEERQIVQDKMQEQLVQVFMQEQLAQMQQAQQAQQMQPPPPGPEMMSDPGMGGPMGEPTGGMAEMPPMQAGGLPPEMLMQGGQGPYPPEVQA